MNEGSNNNAKINNNNTISDKTTKFVMAAIPTSLAPENPIEMCTHTIVKVHRDVHLHAADGENS